MAISRPVNTIVLCLSIATLAPIASAQAQTPVATPSAQTADAQPQQTPPAAAQPQPGQLPPKDQPGVQAPGKTAEGEDKFVLGVLPNYRTAELSRPFHPIPPSYKLKIALKDSFGYQMVALAGAFAALYQLENDHPQFGQGVKGYASRLGTAYADQVIGNMMTEGFMPVVFHEDPRYFRMDHGKVSTRLFYAVSRIFVTKTDSGHETFNFSEIIGNGMAAGIGLAYYKDSRDFGDYAQNWMTACGTDAFSQVLKEFWPDIKRRWERKHHKGDVQ